MPPDNIEIDTDNNVEYASVKFLLKQVYAAHVAKIKNLEEEVKELKQKLEKTQKEFDDYKLECKQCKELQTAFASCKSALQEQTKWFENLGQKFSHLENKSADNGELSIETEKSSTAFHENVKEAHIIARDVLDSLQFTETLAIKATSFIDQQLKANEKETICKPVQKTSPVAHAFLHNDSSINLDHAILAPDSLDVIECKRMAIDVSTRSSKSNQSSSEQSNNYIVPSKLKSRNKDNKISDDSIKIISTKKRLCSDSENLNGKTKKCSRLNSDVDSSNNIDKPTNSKTSDKRTAHSDGGKRHRKADLKIKSLHKMQETEMEITYANSKIKTSSEIAMNLNAIVEDNEENLKCNSVFVEPISLKKPIEDSLSCQLSPSLIVAPKSPTKSQTIIPSDNEDFQNSVANNNYPTEEGSWKSCNRKKLPQKNVLDIKSIKCTSKFKMLLDTPPLNYKKPNFKQTKLSKKIFQVKVPKDLNNEASKISVLNSNADISSKRIPFMSVFANSGELSTVDFDATLLPESCKLKMVQAGAIDDKSQNKCDIVLLEDSDSSQSEDLLTNASEEIVFKANSNGKGSDPEEINEDHEFKENMNSFDRLPEPEEPNYKYKEETVRNKAQRKNLEAYACNECEKFYDEMGLSDKEKQMHMKKCSRHRAKYVPPATPDHFWELEFPDTQECKARGYLNETQKVSLKSRRRRPL